MPSIDVEVTSQNQLHCTYHTIIFRNESLEDKYPGGFDSFINRYSVEFNDHITVYRVTNAAIASTNRELEIEGLNHGDDFVAIDAVECEMWRMIHSDDIERPFWFDTGADWVRYKQWRGRVVVWYDG